MANVDLVCFGERAWDAAGERTKELLGRFGGERRTFYVEPPLDDAGPARVDIVPTREKVWIVTLRAPEGTDVGAVLGALVAAELCARSVERPIVWFETCDSVPLAGGVEASTIVYDVEANPASIDRQRVLFGIANVVFAATPDLYDDARLLHPRVVPLASPTEESSWDVAWAEMIACLAARTERRFPSRWPSPRDTLDDEELAEETQPVVCIPT